MKQSADFPLLLQLFFTKRLIAQRRASPHTIASYRDTFRLLLQFAEKELHKRPSEITFDDLSPTIIEAFLDDLERRRRNGVRSRNLRMTSIRSFFRYAALEVPQHAGSIQRVLAIPRKRHERRLVGFLSRDEIDVLLSAPDRSCWLGRRDHALLLTAIQTGLRVSELTALRQQDVVLNRPAHIRCEGKGRKERCTPLAKTTVSILAEWVREQGPPTTLMLFPNADVVRIVDVADVLALESDAACRCSGTENREVLLAVVHGLHEVVASTEVYVQRWSKLKTILGEDVECVRVDRAFRIAKRLRGLGHVTGQERPRRAEVFVHS
jgi:site-specific recombinase XerD